MSSVDRRSLSPLTGEFTDPRLENEYRVETWADRQSRVRFVGIVAATFYLLGLVIDLLEPRLAPLVGRLIVIRVAVAVTLLLAVRIADRLRSEPRRVDGVIAVALLIVAAGTSEILSMAPQSLLPATVTVIVMVMVFYVFVPIRATLVLLSGLTLSATFVAVVLAGYRTGPGELAVVVFYLVLVNLLGALSNRHVRMTRRRRYLTLLDERAATEGLRREIAARAEAERQLAESEARFRSLVELSPDAILVHRRGNVLYVNPAGLRLMAVPSAEPFIGRSFLDFVHPEDRDTVTSRRLQLEQSSRDLPTTELRLRTLDGRELSCEVLSGVTVFGGEPAVQSVVRDISDRKNLEEELTRLASTDPLTGIANRRTFFDQLEREWSRASRYSRRLSILMFDIDHFKRVNDTHGHAVGDRVLIALVEVAGELLRADDVIARLGGEEFAILLPEVGLEGAVAAGERLRKRLGETRVETTDGEIGCTVSVGVVECRIEEETFDAALKRVDDALYRAKREGRDRVGIG